MLFDSLPDAYAAAKTINRRDVARGGSGVSDGEAAAPRRLSLLAALLAVALPSLAYTGTLMTENAFYPAFLVAVWALLCALDSPTLQRQLLLLAACGLVTGGGIARSDEAHHLHGRSPSGRSRHR